jgi:hypothetical protein
MPADTPGKPCSILGRANVLQNLKEIEMFHRANLSEEKGDLTITIEEPEPTPGNRAQPLPHLALLHAQATSIEPILRRRRQRRRRRCGRPPLLRDPWIRAIRTQ